MAVALFPPFCVEPEAETAENALTEDELQHGSPNALLYTKAYGTVCSEVKRGACLALVLSRFGVVASVV